MILFLIFKDFIRIITLSILALIINEKIERDFLEMKIIYIKVYCFLILL